MYLFDSCFKVYPKTFHFTNYGHPILLWEEIQVNTFEEPTTICKLLQDLPTYGLRGSQHELNLTSQPSSW